VAVSIKPKRLKQATDKVFVMRLKPPCLGTSPVVAEQAEIQGEHLVLLNSQGKLAGLFLMEIVESWSELPNRPH
jgi:hypothetical protein